MRTFTISVTLVVLAFFGASGEKVDSQKTLKWTFEGYGVQFELYQDNILKATNSRGEGVQISIHLFKDEVKNNLVHFGLGSAHSKIQIGSMGGPRQVIFLGEGERVEGEVFEIEVIATKKLVAKKTRRAGKFLQKVLSQKKEEKEEEPEKVFTKKIILD